jgi:hypothetical protein
VVGHVFVNLFCKALHMRYIATAKFPVQVDGKVLPAGSQVVSITIDTDVPKHQIISMLNACEMTLADEQPSAEPVAPVKPKEAKKAAEPEKIVEEDPPEQIDISGFPGLDPKLAEKLVVGKIVDADKSVRYAPMVNADHLAEIVDSGFDLMEIDGIGKLNKAKILKWLDEQGNAPLNEDEEEDPELDDPDAE